MPEQKVIGRMKIISLRVATSLAARGESLAAFDERCIPSGGVAPPSNTPGILSRRALPAGRLARLGATPDFHHGLLGHQAATTTETWPCALREDRKSTELKSHSDLEFSPTLA